MMNARGAASPDALTLMCVVELRESISHVLPEERCDSQHKLVLSRTSNVRIITSRSISGVYIISGQERRKHTIFERLERHMKRSTSLIRGMFFVAMVGLLAAGCDSSTGPGTDGTLSLSSIYTGAPPASSRILSKGSGAMAEISITRARFVLRDIKFKSVGEDSLNFKTTPFVLELNLSGAPQTISSVPGVPGMAKLRAAAWNM